MTYKFPTRFAVLALSLVFALGVGIPFAHAAALTSTLDLGDRGANVTSLQTYLATNGSWYPQGLVTGYFGPLTQAAVERFQSAQGIVTSGTPATTGYGRVGPMTLARINALMAGGVATSASFPYLSTPTVQVGNTSATIHWTTNEPTTGQVYWGTTPPVASEATGPNQVPPITGNLALDTGGLLNSHSVTIANLAPNTTYYYMIRAINSSNGITITWPAGSIHTAQ